MRESRTSGSVGRAPGNRCPYPDSLSSGLKGCGHDVGSEFSILGNSRLRQGTFNSRPERVETKLYHI